MRAWFDGVGGLPGILPLELWERKWAGNHILNFEDGGNVFLRNVEVQS
jgi:hypothetical protein